MSVLCFTVIALVRKAGGSEEISAFSGLHRRSPFLAFALLVGVVSLAGLPLTAGFIGKFFVFTLAVDQGRWATLAIAAAAAATGFYYYLKVARAMYWEPAPKAAPAIPLSPATKLTLAALVAAILVLGVFPAPLLRLLP
jgi:NADH-quinone oxidoreductase subunit N